MDPALLNWTPEGAERYPKYPGACDLPGKQLQSLIKQHVLMAYSAAGDDPPSPSNSVDTANNSYFFKEGGKVKLRKHNGAKLEIRRISKLPFKDLMLTPDGNKILSNVLSNEAVRYIRKFTKFIKTTNVAFESGRFQCPGTIAGSTGSACRIKADRPCPLYYSASQEPLRATTVEPLGIPGRVDGRVIVHLDSSAEPIPSMFRREIVYAGSDCHDYTSIAVDTKTMWCVFKVGGNAALGTLEVNRGNEEVAEGVSQRLWWRSCNNDSKFTVVEVLGVSENLDDCHCGSCKHVELISNEIRCKNTGSVIGNYQVICDKTEAELQSEEDTLDVVFKVCSCLDKFPGNLTIKNLSSMVQCDEDIATSAILYLAAQGHVRACKTCYGEVVRSTSERVGKEPRRVLRRELLAKDSILRKLSIWHDGVRYFKTSGVPYKIIDNKDGTAHCVKVSSELAETEQYQPEHAIDVLVGAKRKDRTVMGLAIYEQ